MTSWPSSLSVGAPPSRIRSSTSISSSSGLSSSLHGAEDRLEGRCAGGVVAAAERPVLEEAGVPAFGAAAGSGGDRPGVAGSGSLDEATASPEEWSTPSIGSRSFASATRFETLARAGLDFAAAPKSACGRHSGSAPVSGVTVATACPSSDVLVAMLVPVPQKSPMPQSTPCSNETLARASGFPKGSRSGTRRRASRCASVVRWVRALVKPKDGEPLPPSAVCVSVTRYSPDPLGVRTAITWRPSMVRVAVELSAGGIQTERCGRRERRRRRAARAGSRAPAPPGAAAAASGRRARG